MPDNIQHTLLNLEIAPPAVAWEGITAQLNAEYDVTEMRIAQKLEAWEATPPATAWAVIAATLPAAIHTEQPQPARIVLFPFRKIAAAAAILALVSVTVWYFFSNTDAKIVARGQMVAPATTGSIPSPINKIPLPQPDVAANTISKRPLSQRLPGPIARYDRRTGNHLQAGYQPENQAITVLNLPYAGLNVVRPVTPGQSPNVVAPPIRDANGHIILDTDLIRSDDNNYIVVTGPNGEQTRISSKFLHMLSSMNEDVEPHEYFDVMVRENNLWKIRFREWRSKILQQASFIPSATNFLDIMELKDMLQEN